jgi:hypothetical protein
MEHSINRHMHQSMEAFDGSESAEGGRDARKLEKRLTLRDLYTTLKRASDEGMADVSEPGSQPESPEARRASAGEITVSGSPDREPLRMDKSPSQDSSHHGSYDPSPRDILMTEPHSSSPGGYKPSSTDTSPRRRPGLLGGILRQARSKRTSSSSARGSDSSGTPSPATSPRADEGPPPSLKVVRNEPPSSSAPVEIAPRRMSVPVVSAPSNSLSSSPVSSKDSSSGTVSLLQRSSGKVERLAAERLRKKEEKRAMKEAKKQEKLHRREADELIELVMSNAMTVSMETLLHDLPKLKLVPSVVVEPVCICSGPSPHDELTVQSGSAQTSRGLIEVAGRTVSTYPLLPGRQQKEGSPICDSYFAQVQRDGVVIACIADGCGWGPRPREAAIKAKVALVDHISKHMPVLREAQMTAEILVRGMGEAHYKVMEGKDDVNSAGTTTLLGGVLAPVDRMDRVFCFLFISVGDCKAFCRKSATGKFIDLTMGSRNNVSDAKDPGGRVGPQMKGGMPDLRNLRVSYCICEENDILVLTSDGLSDNFDPEFQGLLPREVGIQQAEKWADVVDVAAGIKAKGDWGCAKMAQLVDAAAKEEGIDVSPALLVGTLIDYCVVLTQSSREWLENVAVGQLPEDYKLYPGKMDHTSILAFRVVGSGGVKQ